MIFEPKTIALKNGQTAVFKTPEIEDAAMLLHYITSASAETNFLTRCPEDWGKVGIRDEERWIDGVRSSPYTTYIACYIEGKVVGACEIRFSGDFKTRHRATIGIAILQECWGLGIGSAMFKEMIELARLHDIEILELCFIEGNTRARALYEKFGFRILSMRPNTFKLRDGTYLGEYYMQKDMRLD